MKKLPLTKAFTLIEPGPVVLLTTRSGGKDNVMTLSWTVVMDFTPRFGIVTGAWNHSFAALKSTRECVLAIPPADMIDTVIGIGTCSGADTDKFAKFGLTRQKGKYVDAPLIAECFANIECRVVDFVGKHDLIVLQGLAAYRDDARAKKGMLHAVGDGTFLTDGRKLTRRAAMKSKLPEGV